MNRPKLTLAVLGFAIFILLVGVTRTTPLAAGSPNAAVPTIVLPTPAATRPASAATAPAKVATRALVPPMTRPTAVLPKSSKRVALGLTGTYGSGISCVNLGTADARLTLILYRSDTAGFAFSYSDPAPIPVGSSRNYFTPSSPPGIPSPFSGSAAAASNQPLACNVNTQRNDAGVGGQTMPARMGTSESADATRAATTLYAPQLFKNFSGTTYNSYLAIQNSEATAQTVSVSYKDRYGTAYPGATQSVSIPAASNHVFYQDQNVGLPNNFLGSAVVTSAGRLAAVANLALYAPNIAELNPIDGLATSLRTGSAVIQAAAGGTVVAIVNEDNRGTCNGASCPPIPPNQIGQGSTYEAFANGTGTVFLMQVPSHVGSEDYSGGFQIGNTTGAAGTCDITFPAAPAANQYGVTLPANGSIGRYAPDVPNLPWGYNGSVKVTCTQPVVGISNFSARNSNYFGDTLVTARGLNL